MRVGTVEVEVREGVVVVVEVLAGVVLLLVAGRVTVVVREGTVVVFVFVRAGVVVVLLEEFVFVLDVLVVASVLVLEVLFGWLEIVSNGLLVAPRGLSEVLFTTSLLPGVLVVALVDVVCEEEPPPLTLY